MQLMTQKQKLAALDKRDSEKKAELKKLNQRRNNIFERQLLKQWGVEL